MRIAVQESGAEAALEPDLPVIDAHHHLWDLPARRYATTNFQADIAASGHRVTATVFVQANSMERADGPAELRPLGETEFAARSATAGGATAICAAIVGYADLTVGAGAEAVLERHLAATPLFRGIRGVAVWDEHRPLRTAVHPVGPGLLLDGDFRKGFAALGPLGLSFDCWAYFTQAHELADLADAFPGTAMISNHIGGLLGIGPYANRKTEVFAAWRRAIRDLAKRPNVVMKIGGLAMERTALLPPGTTHPPSSLLVEAWRPYIETCIDAFGPARCMFESNFPVDRTHCDYVALWNAFKLLTRVYSADERDALFRGTAARVYRLN